MRKRTKATLLSKFEEWLGEPDLLKKRLIAMVILNMILCSEDWLRYLSFEHNWYPGISLAKISNGAGDDLLLLFAAEGIIVKGYDHESSLSAQAREVFGVWPDLYDQTPPKLLALLVDEAFGQDSVTFCICVKPRITSK